MDVNELRVALMTEKMALFPGIKDSTDLKLYQVSIKIGKGVPDETILAAKTEDKEVIIGNLSQYFDIEHGVPKNRIHVIVEQTQGYQVSNKRFCDIPISGPVYEDIAFMLPFQGRDIFTKVVNGMLEGRSFIVHGPYQSGKSSLLLAIRKHLELDNDRIIFKFDMTITAKSLMSQELCYTAILDKLSMFFSFQIFGKEMDWNKFQAKLNQLPSSHSRIYILIDEFQAVFGSSVFLDVAKDLFKVITNSMSVSYLGVGTFQLMELLNDDGRVENSPFNKATFIRMPPFDLKEMGTLFTRYKTTINPDGIIPPLQTEIVNESSGHPASFMMLLTIADTYNPDSFNWSKIYADNMDSVMNGTHRKIMDVLKKLTSKEKAEVRGFIANGMKPWRQTFDDLIRHLLGIGILVTHGADDLRFTSGIIYRVCIEALFPKPTVRLSRDDIGDPITLLKLGAQCITPSTLNDSLVRIKHGTQEKSFQAAFYTAINGLLPTNMRCLFEAKANGKEHLDLMVMEGESNWAAYEFKVGAVTEADFKDHLIQAVRYRDHFEREIYLVNFYPESHQTPETLANIPQQITDKHQIQQ
ncbi:hypothetical protein BGZ49_008890 [Haplosporangium sp. Z 27]|nr:hypothetical protein BGZ49_008890 [Haplosporangium sp. Z 27]